MSDKPKLGIGALSRATGIHSNTIRTWERRYGVPEAQRTFGGHRTYDASVVVHLNMVKQALALGHRPSLVLGLTNDELAEMVSAPTFASVSVPSVVSVDEASALVSHPWISAVLRLDGDALDREFRTALAEMGVLAFLAEGVAPFLEAVGRGWMNGKLDVYHEHFASSRLTNFLGGHWRGLSAGASGPKVVLACFPDEQHTCGLHMAAWVFARRGWRVVFVGADCPVPDIVAAADVSGALAIAVSVSVFARDIQTQRYLQHLIDATDDTTIVLGGAGALAHPRVVTFSDLAVLDAWARRQEQP